MLAFMVYLFGLRCVWWQWTYRDAAMDDREEDILGQIAELEAILADWEDDGSYERRWTYQLLSLCLEWWKARMRRGLH